MDISWFYLDKQTATIDAIKDFESMIFILKNTQLSTSRLVNYINLKSPTKFHLWNYKDFVNINMYKPNNILKIKSYYNAIEYMRWFLPAWNCLTSEEQFILKEFFIYNNSKTMAVENISENLFLERAQVYRRKDKALLHLSTLLYGK